MLHPGGSFAYWPHAKSLTCNANIQSTNTSHKWIAFEHTNHKKKGLLEIPQWKVLPGTEFWNCNLQNQVFFALQPYLPYSIRPFSCLHPIGPHWRGQKQNVLLSKIKLTSFDQSLPKTFWIKVDWFLFSSLWCLAKQFWMTVGEDLSFLFHYFKWWSSH